MYSAYEEFAHEALKELTPGERRVQDRLETKIRSICQMYRNGRSLRYIAGVHKTSHETIRQILRSHGITVTERLTAEGKHAVGSRLVRDKGYTYIYVGKNHPGATKTGWMLEHRYIMQHHLGRPLKIWELVHHKDRNKNNNTIANLELTTSAEHPTCLKCPYYEYFKKVTGKDVISPEVFDKS